MNRKTALVLGGGGSRGAYGIGVWQALKEMGIKIDIVTGTSIGALNGAVVAQDIFEDAHSFWKGLETNMVFDYEHILENGGVKFTTIKEELNKYLDENSIRNSIVEYGIVTVEFPSM